MADSPSTKTAPANKRPTLLPQAEHAGKPAMPLGAHQFTLIGARNRAHLHLLSSTISRNHACIITTKSGVYVRDLASRNGVIVNGRKVRESELNDGDLMQVGSFKFKFQEPPGPIRLATTPRPPLAMLEMDGRLTPMDERTILIGRRPGCDITLDSPAISNTHAVIFECDGKRYVRDLGSRTGTQVNGSTVHQQALEIGDQIKIGSTTLRYIAADMPSVEADESLPLDLEPAAAHEEIHAPVDLHFEEPLAPEAEETAPVAHAELDPIPLIEPASEHAEPASPAPVELAPAMEFPTEPVATAPAELPVEEQIPLPVEEEIPLVQQDVTAPVPVVDEPAESLSVDAWTPPSDQTVTADAAAIEPATPHEEPIAFEPEHPVADESSEPSAKHPAIEEFAIAPAAEEVHTPEESAALEPLPFDESPAAEAATAVESVEAPPVETITGEAEATELEQHPSPVEEHPTAPEEAGPAPDLSIEAIDATSPEEPLASATSEVAPEPKLDEVEPVAAEPEASPLEAAEAPVEPDLAETPEPAQAEQAPLEVTPSPVEEAHVSIEDQPTSIEAVAIEEPPAPEVPAEAQIAPLHDAVGESPAAPEPESDLPVSEAVAPAQSATAQETDQSETQAADLPVEQVTPAPEAHAEEVAPEPQAAEPEMEIAVSSMEEPRDALDVTAHASEAPADIQATAAESSEPQEITPSGIDKIDLSTVTFDAGATEAEPTVDTTPEAPAQPVPLLDLVSPAPAQPVEPEAAQPAEETSEMPASTGKKRAARSPRKKQGTSRSRRRKSDVVAEAVPAATEQQLTAPIAEAASAEVAAIDATPSASEPGFVASEATADFPEPTTNIEPETSVTTELSTAPDSTATAAAEPLPIADDANPAASEDITANQPETSVATELSTPADSTPTTAAEHLPTLDDASSAVSERIAAETPEEPLAAEAEPTAERVEAIVTEQHTETVTAPPTEAVQVAEPEPTAEVIEAIPAEQPAEVVTGQSTEAVELTEPLGTASVEALDPLTESAGAPQPIEPPQESLSDFEAASVHEAPAEPEPASTSVEPEFAAAESGSEMTASIPREPGPIVPVESTSVPIPEEPFALDEVQFGEEEPPTPTPAEATAEPAAVSTEEFAAAEETAAAIEETPHESPVATTVEPSGELGFPPLVEAELPPLPDEAAARPETSEITSHASFVTPAEDSTTSVSEVPVETLEGTEPTPESALDLEPSLSALDSEFVEMEPVTHPDGLLSDTAFGEIVTDFASQEAGPLVEETTVTPSEIAPAAKTDSETPAEHSHILTPLSDADLPPLELGEALNFGSDPIETLAAKDSVDVVADEATPDQPVVIDSTSSPAELGLTAPAGLEELEPPLDLEPTPEIAPELTTPVVEEPSFDAGLEWEEPAAPLPQVDESGLEFEEPFTATAQSSSGSPAPDTFSTSATIGQTTLEPSFVSTESETASVAEPEQATPEARAKITPPPPSRPAGPPMNPFFGMERDLGSFIGGMPLTLGTPPPQAQAPASRPSTSAPTAIAAPAITPAATAETHGSSEAPAESSAAVDEPLTFTEQPKEELDLDRLFEGEEPLELFDETPEQLDKLPDSLEPISDLGSAIGEPLKPAPSASPTSTAEISVAPAAPLRSLTADASSVRPKPPAASVSVPPFAGTGRAGKPGANPFAAALGGLRPTDVFSQTAFPPMAESTFKAQPLDIPSMTAATSGGAGLAPPPGSDSGAPPLKTDGDAIATAPPPPRPVAPRPTAAMLADHPGERRPWWKNLRVLLPLLLVLILAAVVVIIRFFPPKTVVHGTLQIKGIEDHDLGVYTKREQIRRVREELTSAELREAVRQRLNSQGISAGFAGSDVAMASLADPSNSPFEDGRLVLGWPKEDSQDETRMRAVLQTAYLMNKTAAEQTAQIRGQAAAAAEKAKSMATRADAQHQELTKLADQVKATGGAVAENMLLDPSAAVGTLQQQDADLRRALDQANAEVKKKHDEWQQAQDAAHQGAATDPKVLQIRENLASLNARLTVARVSGQGQADPAKAFQAALGDLDGDLTLFAGVGSNNPTVTSYISTARQASAQIHSLLEAGKQDAARIDDLRQQLAAHREAHLRQIFAADDTLKGLLEERDAQAHRFGAASDSGYTQDAARIRGVMDELDQKIEARRQSLATTGQSSDDLQQNLEQTIAQLQEDQSDKQSKIVAALGRLEIPAAGKLQLSDEQQIDRIGRDVAAAKADYEQYAGGAKPSGGDAAGEVQKLQAQIAEQQAQLDAYEQRSDAKGAVATARQALDAAQDAQAKAQAAYAANLNELTLARRYRDEQALYNDSTTAHEAADRDAQAKAAEAGATPILLPPNPNSVQLVSQPDQRVWYLAGAIGLIVLLFAAPLWLAVREPQAQVPYAAAIAQHHAAETQQRHDEDFPLIDDDEHPALT